MSHTRPRKLIETVIPLPEINDASAYDKMPGIGPHPKGIHHWWARLPLPCARAILFASVVDDPADVEGFEALPEKEKDRLLAEREKLFDLIRRLLQKKPHEHPEVFEEAREVLRKACGDKMPEVLDPFTGGGSIPLEAQRLGFQAHGRDLNPVPALITKATIDYPARYFGKPAVNPEAKDRRDWKGAQGLADDVRYYGNWMLEKAREMIGHLYPNAEVTAEMAADRPDLETNVGQKLPVIAWIWARTVESPDPAFAGKQVPLVSTYWLSSKKGKEAWLEPVVHADGTWEYRVRMGRPEDPDAIRQGSKAPGRGSNFICLLSGASISGSYIKGEASKDGLGCRLIAVVADGGRKRVYLDSEATGTEEAYSDTELPGEIPKKLTGGTCYAYGLSRWHDLFSPRQLTALTTFSDLVQGAHGQILEESGDEKYAAAVATYLTMAANRCADFNNSICRWASDNQKIMNLFNRQAIPMAWDFSESNILGQGVGSWSVCYGYSAKCIETIAFGDRDPGKVAQQDAARTNWPKHSLIISTDPPYYDNIGYADLSDFFYVWLRRSLREIEPELTRTMLTPKTEELIAIAHRHGGDAKKAKEHFEGGFRSAFSGMKEALDPRFPLTVYYAMKQSEDTDSKGEGSTGWETLLNALIDSGFQITSTWPLRATQQWKMNALNANALASYILLSCRLRPEDAPIAMRRDFLAELRRDLPFALERLQKSNIPPVDLAQAAIGPGMAIYSRYREVQEPDGSRLSVRTVLQLINQALGEVLDGSDSEFDPQTIWAINWFKEFGFEPGESWKADDLCRAKDTAMETLQHTGIIELKRKEVRLLRRDELPPDWDPMDDPVVSIWEATEHLIRRLREGGEDSASELLAQLGTKAEAARDLAYLLFTVCERKGWSKEALAYNSLVISWPSLVEQARTKPRTANVQEEFGL